jgi:hypothetical protein
MNFQTQLMSAKIAAEGWHFPSGQSSRASPAETKLMSAKIAAGEFSPMN